MIPRFTPILLSALALLNPLGAFGQNQPDGESPREQARANFQREIVLGADDTRRFPDAPDGYKSVRGDIPAGRVESFEYESGVTGTVRAASVYLPPNYSSERAYPVLYLLHGIGGDETEWLRFTQTNVILDNLIADGKAEPMIVVMPNGRAIPDDRAVGEIFAPDKIEGFAKFERDLLEFLIPAVEKRYSVKSKRESRALAGLSMGGGQSLNFALSHLDRFAWLGAFSAAPNTKDPAELMPSPEKVSEKLKLFYLSCGNKDALINVSQRVQAYLKSHDIPHIWNVDDFGHDAETWGSNLYHFAQRLFR